MKHTLLVFSFLTVFGNAFAQDSQKSLECSAGFHNRIYTLSADQKLTVYDDNGSSLVAMIDKDQAIVKNGKTKIQKSSKVEGEEAVVTQEEVDFIQISSSDKTVVYQIQLKPNEDGDITGKILKGAESFTYEDGIGYQDELMCSWED